MRRFRHVYSGVENGLTLVELLVTVAIIVILAGLFFPRGPVVRESARKTEAKNDETQIVTAVKAYYTEYGAYPTTSTTDVYYGNGSPPLGIGVTNNSLLFDVLRDNSAGSNSSTVTLLNPRHIVFLEISKVKNIARPVYGAIPNGSPEAGVWFDPWGSPYNVLIDAAQKGELPNPYKDAPGGEILHTGVIAWSFGKNGVLGGGSGLNNNFTTESGTANRYSGSGDIISWQ